MEIFNKELVLHDKNWTRNELTITNELWYFSICNTHGQNRFESKNELQQKLLDIWNTYHLKNIDQLPDNFEEYLFNIIDKLQEEEDEYNDRLITEEDIENDERFVQHADDNCDWEVEKLMAACLECWVSFNWLENVTSSNGFDWEIEWQDYCIYTDEEADEAHLKDVESFVDELWMEWFNKDYLSWPYVTRLQNGNIEVIMSIEIWAYERWNSLARYDWKERYQVVNWTTYYLYKC